MSDLVSIITPSYNSEQFILQAINSVINQSYINWEMIIVDDSSEDNSKDVISSVAESESRIRTFFLDSNVGPAEARNLALRNAKGKYIAFLDSDDFWHPQKLYKQILFMQRNDIAFSYTSYQLVSEDGLNKKKIIRALSKISYFDYLKNTIIGCLTVIIDVEKTGFFEMPNIRSSHDMALWLLIMKRGFAAYGLDEDLASYRLVHNSNSSSKIKAAKDVWRVYRKEEKLSFFYSFWCFINYAFNAIKKRVL